MHAFANGNVTLTEELLRQGVKLNLAPIKVALKVSDQLLCIEAISKSHLS